MTRSYLQVLKQIETLKAEAEKLRRSEISGVVTRIRDAVAHYGLTAADLGLSGGGGAGPRAARKKPGRKPGRPRKVVVATGKVAPKFRDENGNTWAGRGKRPVGLRTALAAGRKLEDFAIK